VFYSSAAWNFFTFGLESVLGDWMRDHEEAGSVPASGFGRPGNPSRDEAQNLPPGPEERIGAMKKATGLRHAADTCNYFFPANSNRQIDQEQGELAFFRRQFLFSRPILQREEVTCRCTLGEPPFIRQDNFRPAVAIGRRSPRRDNRLPASNKRGEDRRAALQRRAGGEDRRAPG